MFDPRPPRVAEIAEADLNQADRSFSFVTRRMSWPRSDVATFFTRLTGATPEVKVDGGRYHLSFPPDEWGLIAPRLAVAPGLLSIECDVEGAGSVQGVALGWSYEMDEDGNSLGRTPIGEIEYRAKWKEDIGAREQACSAFEIVVEAATFFQGTETVLVPESSRSLSEALGRSVALHLGARFESAAKRDSNRRQLTSDESAPFGEAFADSRNSWSVRRNIAGPVLIVDELVRTGATISELARCLEEQDSNPVSFLSLVKSRRNVRQL
jgi:hypothetical protein